MKLTTESSQPPLEVIYNAIVQSDCDWSSDEPGAVVYAIVCGWHEMMPEIADKFHCSEDQILRLERLRAGFVAQCGAAADD
jgi:hypothetical protein